MNKSKPLVSVVMPAFNVEKYIGEAVESILNQTFKDFELIIIDDASTDNTLSIAENYAKKDTRIIIVKNSKNLQIAVSLNKGINLAKSGIIARMDPDDISYPDRLRIQYEYIKRHPKIAVVGANMMIMNREGTVISKREYPTKSSELKKVMFRYSPFAHPVVMFRRQVFQEFGGYDVNMVPCEDINLWFQIGSKYEFASIPKLLLQYRLIFVSNSHKKLKSLELLGLRIKLKAITEYGYKLSLYDIFYNFLEYTTLFFMPAQIRIKAYNFLRSNNLI